MFEDEIVVDYECHTEGFPEQRSVFATFAQAFAEKETCFKTQTLPRSKEHGTLQAQAK